MLSKPQRKVKTQTNTKTKTKSSVLPFSLSGQPNPQQQQTRLQALLNSGQSRPPAIFFDTEPKPIVKHAGTQGILFYESAQNGIIANVVPALQFEWNLLEESLCEELSPFIINRFLSFHQHAEIIGDDRTTSDRERSKKWVSLLDEIHICEEKRKKPYDAQKHEENLLWKRIIREQPTVMELFLKANIPVIATLDRMLTLSTTIMSFAQPYPVTENEEEDEEDDNEEREEEEEQEKPFRSPTHVDIPVLIHFQKFCTFVDEDVAGRLRNWLYTLRGAKYTDLADLTTLKHFIAKAIRNALARQLPTEMLSPIKMMENAARHHQEQMQQFGSIVGNAMDHRQPLLQKCYSMYQRFVKHAKEQRKAIRSQEKNSKNKFQEAFDRMYTTVSELTKASLATQKHNEKVQNILLGLLEKLQKPSVPIKPASVEPKPDYRAALENKDMKK
jgi:hypothetical protein